MKTPRLALRNLRKAYGNTIAVDCLDLEIGAGEVHALLGANGSGKSTVVKILAGVVTSDAGTISLDGQELAARDVTPNASKLLGLRFVHQDPAVFPTMSVMENLALGHGYPTTLKRVSWSALRQRATALIERFDLDCAPETRLGSLGPAQRTMVAIARGLQDELDDADAGRLLVLDEPTASLSATEADHLLAYMRALADKGTSILYITHRLHELEQAADMVTVMRDGAKVHTGAYGPDSLEVLTEHIAGRALGEVYPSAAAEPAGPLLSVDGLSAPGLAGISFTARAGEVLGIAGFLGSGRSHLLECLFGASPRAGTLTVDGVHVPAGDIAAAMDADMAFVPEDRLGMAGFADLSLRENLSAGQIRRYWRKLWLDLGREKADSSESLAEYLVKADSQDQLLTSLSGGNQQKLIMARWLRRFPRVMLLDEPTQGVDAGARREIYRMIRSRTDGGATALVVSSDFEELAKLSDRVLILSNGRIIDEVSGDNLTASTLTRLCFTTDESRTA
ncbi:sugar ABC transporter ATP-binding protein [Paeniglutamicibacter sp.]|uniref:sugar ABC transporter ATP-binding protein n=1 Tax=Paeniglutamicibacter sp. TaxID=1934391 RepID=UPI003988A3A6